MLDFSKHANVCASVLKHMVHRALYTPITMNQACYVLGMLVLGACGIGWLLLGELQTAWAYLTAVVGFSAAFGEAQRNA